MSEDKTVGQKREEILKEAGIPKYFVAFQKGDKFMIVGSGDQIWENGVFDNVADLNRKSFQSKLRAQREVRLKEELEKKKEELKTP